MLFDVVGHLRLDCILDVFCGCQFASVAPREDGVPVDPVTQH